VTFDRQPVLVGELLELRPLTGDDFDALYEIARDPLLWEQHPSKERSQPEGFRVWFKEAMESGGTLVAIERISARVVATSRFHCLDPECSELEIGWTFIAREHWGGTYNGEMKRLMLDHAFAHYDHVIFKVHSENFRSQRAVSKLGAVLIGDEEDLLGRGTNVVFRLDRPVP
jgi:N-acetyltransferase